MKRSDKESDFGDSFSSGVAPVVVGNGLEKTEKLEKPEKVEKDILDTLSDEFGSPFMTKTKVHHLTTKP